MDNDISKRVLELRKALKKTQAEFSKELGVTYQLISAIEVGRTPLTESNLKHICLTFGVNETWLRTGEGDMKAVKVGSGDDLIDMYRKLSPDVQKTILDLVRALYDSEQALRPQP